MHAPSLGMTGFGERTITFVTLPEEQSTTVLEFYVAAKRMLFTKVSSE
jgi:hypothetical protein